MTIEEKLNRKIKKLLKKSKNVEMHCTTMILMVQACNDNNGGLEILKRYVELAEQDNILIKNT